MFGTIIIPQFLQFVNMFIEIYPITFRKAAVKLTNGECVTVTSVHIQTHAGSFHHFVVPLPPGGRLFHTPRRVAKNTYSICHKCLCVAFVIDFVVLN